MDSRFDEDNNLETQVMFGHLESTLAVRCLARNEMAAVSREIKLVSSGESFTEGVVVGSSGAPSIPSHSGVGTVFGKVLPVLWQLSADGLGMILFAANSLTLKIIKPFEPFKLVP